MNINDTRFILNSPKIIKENLKMLQKVLKKLREKDEIKKKGI